MLESNTQSTSKASRPRDNLSSNNNSWSVILTRGNAHHMSWAHIAYTPSPNLPLQRRYPDIRATLKHNRPYEL